MRAGVFPAASGRANLARKVVGWPAVGGRSRRETNGAVRGFGQRKAVLANSGPDTIRRMLATELPRYTDTTIIDPDELRAELATIRDRGFAVNHGEWRSDVGSVAAVVMGGDDPIASLSVNIPMTRLTEESEPVFGSAVREAASSLSARLR